MLPIPTHPPSLYKPVQTRIRSHKLSVPDTQHLTARPGARARVLGNHANFEKLTVNYQIFKIHVIVATLSHTSI